MDIINEAEQVSDAQQKQHITKELLETYETLLDISWELIIEQRMVINGEMDRSSLGDTNERLDAMDTMEKAINAARACLKVD